MNNIINEYEKLLNYVFNEEHEDLYLFILNYINENLNNNEYSNSLHLLELHLKKEKKYFDEIIGRKDYVLTKRTKLENNYNGNTYKIFFVFKFKNLEIEYHISDYHFNEFRTIVELNNLRYEVNNYKYAIYFSTLYILHITYNNMHIQYDFFKYLKNDFDKLVLNDELNKNLSFNNTKKRIKI